MEETDAATFSKPPSDWLSRRAAASAFSLASRMASNKPLPSALSSASKKGRFFRLSALLPLANLLYRDVHSADMDSAVPARGTSRGRAGAGLRAGRSAAAGRDTSEGSRSGCAAASPVCAASVSHAATSARMAGEGDAGDVPRADDDARRGGDAAITGERKAGGGRRGMVAIAGLLLASLGVLGWNRCGDDG